MNKSADKIKILLIEDDEFIAKMYSSKFEKSGFNFIIASDGELGLKRIEKEKPDLILLDIILPKKDGFEILKKCKEDNLNIPIILLTNLGQENNIKQGMDLGAKDYIIKAHFTPQEVVDRVKKIFPNA